MAHKPDDAMNWSQAGGIFNLVKAGIWWCSMPYGERIRYMVFVDNQEQIEKNWHKEFGDRHTELVIIGQDLNIQEVTEQLDACLSTDDELAAFRKSKQQAVACHTGVAAKN